MKKHLWVSVKMLLLMTVFTGLIYPLAITGIARVIFPAQANGSLIKIDGRLIGSRLIGQEFKSNKYFWPRPSATGYDHLPSGGSNYGPTSDTLKQLVEARRAKFIRANHLPKNTRVPSVMLNSSASGLDPDITPRSAELQVGRVARARGFDNKQEMELRKLVASHVQGPQLGFLGEPRVNVLLLNLALDSISVNRGQTF